MRSTSRSSWRYCCGRGRDGRRRNALYRLACLEQNTAGDLHAAVGLLLQCVQRLPRLAIGVDDVNALRDLAVRHLRLAKFETLVAIDRGVSLLDHAEKDIGLREHALDRGSRIGIGRRRIVAAEGVNLGADDGLRGGNIVAGPGRRAEADQECDQQDKGAHEAAPWAYCCFTRQPAEWFQRRAVKSSCLRSARCRQSPGRSQARACIAYNWSPTACGWRRWFSSRGRAGRSSASR